MKNHHVVTFILKNKNKIKRIIRSKKVESFNVNKKLLKDSLMNEWKIIITKNELTRLIKELNDINYIFDIRKV